MPKPEIHFEIEPHCILTCRHCSSHQIKKESIQFSNDDIIRLVRAAIPNEIYFTGGEPLLFPNLIHLFSKISSTIPNCQLGLFTTGIVYKDNSFVPVELDILNQLFQFGLRICYVSLYSDEEYWHDYMTNTPGSFVNTVQAIHNMRAAGIDVRINLVITQFNYSRVRDIIDFVSGLSVSEVRLLKLIQHGNAVNYWDTIGISDQEYMRTVSAIHSCRKEYSIRITFSSIPTLASCRPLKNACGCQARIKLLYVTLTGDIYPCACVKNEPAFKICNINDDHLEELVNMDLNNCTSYNSCLAEENQDMIRYNESFDVLFSRHFSNIISISKSEDVLDSIRDFVNEMNLLASKNDSFEAIFELNRSLCIYYEIHAFFVKKNSEKGLLECFVSSDISLDNVYSVCKMKFPSSQIQFQVVDTAYMDHYTKEKLLYRLVDSFESMHNPEIHSFIKEYLFT